MVEKIRNYSVRTVLNHTVLFVGHCRLKTSISVTPPILVQSEISKE